MKTCVIVLVVYALLCLRRRPELKQLVTRLCSILVIFIALLSLLFMRFRSRSRHPASSDPHMRARWNHMDTASRRAKVEAEAGEQAEAEVVDEFGMGGGISRSLGGASTGSVTGVPGTGPNGTRTFLRGTVRLPLYPFNDSCWLRTGWFGLDEPTFSGYNNSVDHREKDANGDLLPMTNTSGTLSGGEHQPVARDEDEEWEVASIGEHQHRGDPDGAGSTVR